MTSRDKYKLNYDTCLDIAKRKLFKRDEIDHEEIPEDSYLCVMCNEWFPMMPFSSIPLYNEEKKTYDCAYGNLCKNCFIEVDLFIREKQKQYEIK